MLILGAKGLPKETLASHGLIWQKMSEAAWKNLEFTSISGHNTGDLIEYGFTDPALAIEHM